MRYIEVSKKITLTKEANREEIAQAFLDRLRRAFLVETLEETDSGFHLIGTAGSNLKKFVRHSHVDLTVDISKNQETIRVLAHGHTRTARSLMVSYTILFFLVVIAGLLPGSIETGGESSGSDALVFMILGIFVLYDIYKKIAEPKEHLQAALDSLDVEFG